MHLYLSLKNKIKHKKSGSYEPLFLLIIKIISTSF